MAGPVETGMKKGEMRKLLRRTVGGDPVGCAVGTGDAPGIGLMVLHRTRRGKAMEKLLKEDFPDAKAVRFGGAYVQEDDPKKVYLSLNRAAPGIAKRLIKTLKGTGFTKVVIASEDGVTEGHEEEDDGPIEADPDDLDEVAPAAAAAAPEAAPAAPSAAPSTEAAAAPAEPEPATAAPAERSGQEAALSKALAGLIARIGPASAGDEARKATLGALAKEAAVRIKAGNVPEAAAALSQLKAALDAAPAAANGAPPPPPAAPPPPPPAAAEGPDKGQLARTLAGLIGRIPAASAGDEGRKARLAKLATDVNVNIKTGNLQYAALFLAQLEADLGTAPAAAAAAPSPAADALEKLRLDWAGVRDGVAADVGSLAAALDAAYAGQPFAKEVADRFKAKADPVLARLDDRLGLAVQRVVAAADAAARAAASASARTVLQEVRSFTENDPFIADLDANPFVPLSVRSRTAAALAALADALPA